MHSKNIFWIQNPWFYSKRYDFKDLGTWTTKLIISNTKNEYIIKTLESLEESGILIKGVSEILENKTKEQTGSFLVLLLGILGGSLLGNLLSA